VSKSKKKQEQDCLLI